MLLTFKGKGCENCPFQYWKQTGYSDDYFCSLSKAKLADGTQLPELDPIGSEKPRGCPFAQYPNTLEIQAQE